MKVEAEGAPMLNSISASVPQSAVPSQAVASNDGERSQAPSTLATEAKSESIYTSQSEDIYMKLTNKDGDVLEVHANITEETFVSKSSWSGYSKTDMDKAGKNKAANEDGTLIDTDKLDPEKKSMLKNLREWAKGVEKELRKQQRE